MFKFPQEIDVKHDKRSWYKRAGLGLSLEWVLKFPQEIDVHARP